MCQRSLTTTLGFVALPDTWRGRVAGRRRPVRDPYECLGTEHDPGPSAKFEFQNLIASLLITLLHHGPDRGSGRASNSIGLKVQHVNTAVDLLDLGTTS